MPRLIVWHEGAQVGELTVHRGVWGFRYTAEWLAALNRFFLSPAFPLEARDFVDSDEDRPVRWYFDNLLPEGGVRQALAAFAKIDEGDSLGLLGRYGAESAGALTLLPPGTPFPSRRGYRALSASELESFLTDMPRVPLIVAHGQLKMSLAGAQHKLPVHWDGERLYLPEGAAPSTWILKPEHARPQEYPMTPANEHFCMELARRVGLPVPETALLHAPAPLYLCRRYDRVAGPSGIERLHQIDFLQLINKWPSYKYEMEGGVTLREVFEALTGAVQPAVAKNLVLRWVIFNYLIGNSDAHAKNLSFLVGRTTLSPAPFYDLFSVKIYGDEDMAMAIGGDTRYGWIGANHWDELAADGGVPPSFVRRLRRELAHKIVAEAENLRHTLPFSDAEREFLRRVTNVIETHAGFILEGEDT